MCGRVYVKSTIADMVRGFISAGIISVSSYADPVASPDVDATGTADTVAPADVHSARSANANATSAPRASASRGRGGGSRQ